MTPTVPELCAEAAALCRRLAPRDLDGVPLYVVPQSRIPRGTCGADACAYGFTSGILDLLLGPVIGSEWRGRGAAMVVNDRAVFDLGWPDPRTAFLAVAVHELAHVLDRPAPFADHAAAREPARLQVEADRTDAALVALTTVDGVVERPQDDGHGIPFVRAALHLLFRARAAGYDLPADFLIGHTRLGLSQPRFYRAALSDEPERMAGASFRDILAAPPPVGFTWLFDEDTAPRPYRRLSLTTDPDHPSEASP